MELQQSIHALHTKGYSERKIARTLGIHRKTVHAYLIQANSGSKGTKVPAGSEPPNRHACATFSEQIREKLEQGLSAQRIYQDLQHEHAYKGGYDSIKRYVRKLKQTHPKLIERLESEPGEELQIDYGEAYVLAGTKRKRKAHILRLTLSCSRKSYSEAFTSQHTENFIRGIENAFRYFGGVTACINVDNLKAAVLKADWYDPEINPKLLSFCKHYDTSILPCIPRKPQHKGKVEAGIKYVKNNALKGRIFDSLASLNEHLLDWEQTIADKRIHGTTRKQVGEDFEQNEKPHLKCLPQGLFPCFEEAPRKVHRDGYVTVAKAYYRLGAEYYRANVWARWDARQVRLYDHNMQQIRVYTRLEPGKFSEVLGTQGCPESISQSLQYWQNQVNSYGPHATTWTQRIVHQRGDAALRTLMGISGLNERYSKSQIEHACKQALEQGQYGYRDIKNHLQNQWEQQQLPFKQHDEIIRDLDEYNAVFQSKTA